MSHWLLKTLQNTTSRYLMGKDLDSSIMMIGNINVAISTDSHSVRKLKLTTGGAFRSKSINVVTAFVKDQYTMIICVGYQDEAIQINSNTTRLIH